MPLHSAARSRRCRVPAGALVATLACAASLAIAPAASAQSGFSLDLSADEPAGGRIAVVPPHFPNGALDKVAYRNLFEALSTKYGSRLVPMDETVSAIRSKKLKPVALRLPEAVRWLAAQLKAEHAVVFTARRGTVEIRVFGVPGEPPSIEWTEKWRPRLPKARAEKLVDTFVGRADWALRPPPPKPEPAPTPVA